MQALCDYCLKPERPAGFACNACGYDGIRRNPADTLAEGTRLAGKYVIGRIEGRGGFGICYRALRLSTGELVAIKELFPREAVIRSPQGEVLTRPDYRMEMEIAISCLEQEAQVLGLLTNEAAIVRVYELLRLNGSAYMVMAYLRGRNYDQYLDDQYNQGRGMLHPGQAVNVALVVAGALGSIHGLGLLHLDVKPPNIRLRDDGTITLIDFGAARASFFGYHNVSYTPGFAAIELVREGIAEASPATDLHALAATLYYSLSLSVPPDAAERATGIDPAPLYRINPAVPVRLDEIVARAMSLMPEDRYPSVAAFRDDLRCFGTSAAPAPLPVPPPVPAPRTAFSRLRDWLSQPRAGTN